jgi:putative hydrolase of the HAD superfamily
VFFDAGGVLLVPNWDRVADALAHHGLRVSADRLRAVEPAARFAIDTPRVAVTSDAERGGRYFDGVLDRAGVPRGSAREAALADVYAYHMAHNIWECVPDGVVATLHHLHADGVKLAVASNANGVLGQCLERTGLSRYFDVVCDSGLEGVEKPNREFFDRLLQRSDSRPEGTIHVGDLYYVDVLGARAAGIRPLLLDPLGLYGGFDVERIRELFDVTALVSCVG